MQVFIFTALLQKVLGKYVNLVNRKFSQRLKNICLIMKIKFFEEI